MRRLMRILVGGFWDWSTGKGALNKFEYELRLLAYICYAPVDMYCVIMGGKALTENQYPTMMIIQWIGTVLIWFFSLAAGITCFRNYKAFKRRNPNAPA